MPNAPTPLQTVGLGGGCHWCTEAVFQALSDVSEVRQGFIASMPPNETLSEAVMVTFDPDHLPLDRLIEIHLRTHSSTSCHKMRGKYRSAVYTTDPAQADAVLAALATLQPQFDIPLVTQVLPLVDFQPSQDRFRNYYARDPERPFCKTYIDPKLAMLRQRYSRSLRAFAETGAPVDS